MFLIQLLIATFSGGTEVYRDINYHIRSCTNEPYKLVKYVAPKLPLVSSSQGHLSLWGTLYFEITVNKGGQVTAMKSVNKIEGRLKSFLKKTRRAVKRWEFDKSKKESRCFYVTYVYHQPEIREFD